jgi:hypothetical protein
MTLKRQTDLKLDELIRRLEAMLEACHPDYKGPALTVEVLQFALADALNAIILLRTQLDLAIEEQ